MFDHALIRASPLALGTERVRFSFFKIHGLCSSLADCPALQHHNINRDFSYILRSTYHYVFNVTVSMIIQLIQKSTGHSVTIVKYSVCYLQSHFKITFSVSRYRQITESNENGKPMFTYQITTGLIKI